MGSIITCCGWADSVTACATFCNRKRVRVCHLILAMCILLDFQAVLSLAQRAFWCLFLPENKVFSGV